MSSVGRFNQEEFDKAMEENNILQENLEEAIKMRKKAQETYDEYEEVLKLLQKLDEAILALKPGESIEELDAFKAFIERKSKK
jgi:hypothetical protein